MTRLSSSGRRPVQKMTAIERATASWGEAMPREIKALAEACVASTARVVAQRLGYTDAVVSHMLSRSYRGDVEAVLIRIRGALLGQQADCPVLGPIGKDQCLEEQAKPFSSSNPARARLYRACRGCPSNRKNSGDA